MIAVLGGAIEAMGLILVLAAAVWGAVLGVGSLAVGRPETTLGLLGVYALPSVLVGAPLLLAGKLLRRRAGS